MSKPVAWMLKTGHGTKILEKKPYCEVDYWKPLYTQPGKDLTDKEILDIKTLMEINYGCVPPLEFAWAILAKAQEK